jgi:hypothetical protein
MLRRTTTLKFAASCAALAGGAIFVCALLLTAAAPADTHAASVVATSRGADVPPAPASDRDQVVSCQAAHLPLAATVPERRSVRGGVELRQLTARQSLALDGGPRPCPLFGRLPRFGAAPSCATPPLQVLFCTWLI